MLLVFRTLSIVVFLLIAASMGHRIYERGIAILSPMAVLDIFRQQIDLLLLNSILFVLTFLPNSLRGASQRPAEVSSQASGGENSQPGTTPAATPVSQ